jgi:Flp pilus assembly protein TadD
MNRSIGLKLAVSVLAIGTTIAAWPAAEAMRPTTPSPAQVAKQASEAAAQARALAVKGNFAGALGLAEQAVAATPRDAGYRMLLADLYLKNGRFQSAAATYADVVSLDPSNQRASLRLALCSIAQGRREAAVAVLDAVADTAPAADVGLAYALAGQPKRAIALLEPAAHAPEATGRVRQNLAFAYALAGNWEKARAIASQDVSPADLGPRLAQWASLATPAAAADQVSVLLGVHAAVDSGQPERLALNSIPETNALAAADPAPAPTTPEAASPPVVQVAAMAPEPVSIAAPPAPVIVPAVKSDAPAWAAGQQIKEVTRPLYAEAVQSLVTPQPAVLRTGHALRPRFAGFELPHSAPTHSGTGHFAVQLGAFSSPEGVERAWGASLKRFALADRTPLSTTIEMPGRGVFHRLSVAGFDSRDDADRTCHAIRAKGGACFVRAVAGDAPTRWASRYAAQGTALASR